MPGFIGVCRDNKQQTFTPYRVLQLHATSFTHRLLLLLASVMLSAVAIPPPDSQPSCEVLSWLSLLPSTEFPTELTPSKPPTAKRKRKLSRIPTDSEVRPKCLRHSSPGSVLLDPSATDMAPRPPSTPATPNKGGRPQKGNEVIIATSLAIREPNANGLRLYRSLKAFAALRRPRAPNHARMPHPL